MTYDYREAGVLAGRYYFDARNLGAHDGAAVDEAATRILTPVALTPTLTLTLTPTPTRCSSASAAVTGWAARAPLGLGLGFG